MYFFLASFPLPSLHFSYSCLKKVNWILIRMETIQKNPLFLYCKFSLIFLFMFLTFLSTSFSPLFQSVITNLLDYCIYLAGLPFPLFVGLYRHACHHCMPFNHSNSLFSPFMPLTILNLFKPNVHKSSSCVCIHKPRLLLFTCLIGKILFEIGLIKSDSLFMLQILCENLNFWSIPG